MQKISIALLIIVTVFTAGCALRSDNTLKTTRIVGRDQLGDVRYSEKDVMEKINEFKNGGAQPAAGANNSGVQGEQTQQANVQLEDLAATYDQAVIRTNYGNITVRFFTQDAPVTVNNFMNLAQKGFYNDTKFHRVIPDFMIQGGDPNSKDDDWSNDGTGGPGYYFKDEINRHKIVRGALAMANAGPDTNGSQFFIVTKEEAPWLDGKHTVFGEVIDGMDVVDAIEQVDTNENDHPLADVVVLGIDLMSSQDVDAYKLSPEEQAEVTQAHEAAATSSEE